jgi:putative mRNA 3-end processing factor
MARIVNKIILNHPDSIKTPKLFSQAMSNIHEIKSWRDRRQAVKTAEVIIAPSGMLQGGTAIFYMEKLALHPDNAVFIVSFQVPGTGGSRLMETGMFTLKNREEKVNAKVKHFDFSSHSGKKTLVEFIKGIKGKPKIYVIHGEPDNCDYLAQWARDELELDAVAPTEEEEFTL